MTEGPVEQSAPLFLEHETRVFTVLGYAAFRYDPIRARLSLSPECARLGLDCLKREAIDLDALVRSVHPDDAALLRGLLALEACDTPQRRVIRFVEHNDSAAVEMLICAGSPDQNGIFGALRPARGSTGVHILRSDPGDDSLLKLSDFQLLQRRVDSYSAADRRFTLVLFGVDELARLYRTFGHSDMAAVTPALRERIRQNVPSDALVAADGVGRFFVASEHADAQWIETVIEAFDSAPFEGPSGALVLTLSAGITHVETTEDARKALSSAEEAFSNAKLTGRQSSAVYRPKDESLKHGDAAISLEVIAAMREGRLIPAFQAIVEARTERTVGWEVLARLRLHDGTLWNGGQFIVAAERNGLIGAIDLFMAERALEKLHDRRDIYLSINVSAETMRDRRRLAKLLDLIGAHLEVSDRLTVEITETAAPGDLEDTAAFVKTLHDLGCTVAVDDFGVGYTSFAALKMIKADAVKIDGLYIRNLAKSPENRLFVRSIVSLASGLKMKTVAEMVGTQEEAEMLRAAGVEALQGFYFGQPQIELPVPSTAKTYKRGG